MHLRRILTVLITTLTLPVSVFAAFHTPLELGDTHEEVLLLQRFLNTHGFVVTLEGPGAPGKETDYFGNMTKRAVEQFQQMYAADILLPAGLLEPTGYFGPASIRKANALLTSEPVQEPLTRPTPTTSPTITLLQYQDLLKRIETNRRNTINVVDKYVGSDPITSLSGVTLTDSEIRGSEATLSVLTVQGAGTLAQLTVSGTSTFDTGLTITPTTPPATTASRLYNVGGDLYWAGELVVASTTGTWGSLAGNTYRLTGNVGIGTSTPDATLEVVGTLHAGTTTAPLLDTGGMVCNVEAYGAVGDNATDNYAAIVEAIERCPVGGTVYFPMGVYRIGQTLTLDKPVTLRGAYAPRWTYSSTPRSSIKPTPSFSGSAIIHVRDKSISGETNDNNGGRIVNITVDGNSYGSSVDGIYFEGLVRDWKLESVDITQASGNGFHAAEGTGSGNPRGFTILGLSIYSAALHGFRATALNDSYLEDVLTVGNAQRGFYLSSMGETKLVGSRAVFNALEGLYIDGSSSNGGLQIADFSTDRNDRHGVRISAYGTTTITINGLLTRRDGENGGGGTETPYAGVAIIGSTTAKVAPVIISDLTQIIGVDDGGGGTLSPEVGLRAVNATYVKVGGMLWGTGNAYVNGGNVDTFVVEEDTLMRTGNISDSSDSLYNAKWVSTSTSLSYLTGSVGVGTTSPSRLLHISGASNAGVRTTDTTNNVTGELRADDFQVFVGSISNHDVRLMTNGSSRLSVTTAGLVGIGTTSPSYTLHVASATDGDVAAFSDTNGTCTINPTNTALVCSSDERLKHNILTIPSPLENVARLRGVTFNWNSEHEEEVPHYGFIAQEVEAIFPEFVITDPRGYKMVNTNAFTPVLVEAIKALQLRVDELARTGSAAVLQSDSDTLPERLAEYLRDIGITIGEGFVRVKRIVVDDELCIGETCMTEDDLKTLLERSNDTTTTPPPSPAPLPEETPTASETDPVVDTPEPPQEDMTVIADTPAV